VTEVIEGKHELSVSHPVKIDLRDAHAIRRELGMVYRDMRSGAIETQEGTRLAYVLNLLRQSYETCVLQGRLEGIEAALKLRCSR